MEDAYELNCWSLKSPFATYKGRSVLSLQSMTGKTSRGCSGHKCINNPGTSPGFAGEGALGTLGPFLQK